MKELFSAEKPSLKNVKCRECVYWAVGDNDEWSYCDIQCAHVRFNETCEHAKRFKKWINSERKIK